MAAFGMLIPVIIPLSLVGIVSGHLGMRDIRRNAGILTGKSSAVIGLVTSYLSLFVSSSILASVIWFGTSIASSFEENSAKHLVNEPGFQAAQTAERALENISVIIGQGNTLAAEALAADLGRRLVDLQTLSFAEERNVSEELLSLPPIVYCHLEKDSCVVMLRMRFPVKWGEGEQRDYCRRIWDLLQVSVDELRAVSEGSRVALAIRGPFTYEEMLFGVSDASSGSLPGHEPEFVEFAGQLAAKRRLYACFSAIKPSQEAAHKE